MPPAARPRRAVLAAALTLAAILILPAVYLSADAIRHATALPVPSDPSRVCVTRAGYCPIGAVRLDDPCGCPDPVQGNVVGHVEKRGGPVTSVEPRDWPGDGERDTTLGP